MTTARQLAASGRHLWKPCHDSSAVQALTKPVSDTVFRKRAVAHGFVHGVFFRDTVRRRAEARGVAGWVRNNRDGTVEAVFEGEPDAVERLVSFMHEGPSGARVDRVDVFVEDPEGLTGFDTH
jgi:acylphosphatase